MLDSACTNPPTLAIPSLLAKDWYGVVLLLVHSMEKAYLRVYQATHTSTHA